MKKPFNLILLISTLLSGLGILTSCSTLQMGHAEWDDAYFNSSDKAKIAYARQNTGQNPASTGYPNNTSNNGSINNYPAGNNNNQFNENYTVNPNAADASAAYVNPEYKASGRRNADAADQPQTSQTTTSGGSTYITNNYYDTDHYYRSGRSYFNFGPTLGIGFGMSPGISVGFGYSSNFGWFGPSLGFSYGWGWGWPSYRRRFYDPFWSMGWGWNSWAYNGWGCYSVFDPFWGFGYNPYAYNPWWGWGSPYNNPYYGNAWYGNQGGGGQPDRNSTQLPVNRTRSQMGGSFNPNQASTPNSASGNYVAPSTGGRLRGEQGGPGGLPTNPGTNPTPGNNPSVPVRGQQTAATPTQANPDIREVTPITPRQYQPATNPDSYVEPSNGRGRNVQPTEPFQNQPTTAPSRGNDRFGTGNNTPAPTPAPDPQPSRNFDQTPSYSPSRSSSDGFRVPRQNDNGGGWFRGGNSGGGGFDRRSSGGGFGGGGSFGGGRSSGGGGSFSPPSSGGRRRGQ